MQNFTVATGSQMINITTSNSTFSLVIPRPATGKYMLYVEAVFPLIAYASKELTFGYLSVSLSEGDYLFILLIASLCVLIVTVTESGRRKKKMTRHSYDIPEIKFEGR
jgi:hypothetical protein